MGDTAILDLDKILSADTLFVNRYLCGYSGGQDAVSTIIIKNEKNEVLKESINRNNLWMYSAHMPMIDIVNSQKFIKSQSVSIFFAINSKKENLNQNVLLGVLKFN